MYSKSLNNSSLFFGFLEKWKLSVDVFADWSHARSYDSATLNVSINS